MKKFDRIALLMFLIGLPIATVAAIIDGFIDYTSATTHADFRTSNLAACIGLIFALWMTNAVYVSVKLIFSKTFRTAALTRLTFLRERDEREVLLTGRATRNSFLLTLSILIFLFSLSILNISVYRVADSKELNGKTGTISLGLNINFLKDAADHKPKDNIAVSYFNYPGLPVSNTAIFLFLIV